MKVLNRIKRLILLLIFVSFITSLNLIIPEVLYSVTDSTTSSKRIITKQATSSSDTETSVIEKLRQIEQLKDKIATKVAEIRENEKGGLTGIVKKITESELTLTTYKGDYTISYTDDILFFKLTAASKSSTQAKSIKEGDSITVLGYFSDNKETLSAKYIYLKEKTPYMIGKIADLDKSNYTITVKGIEGSMIIDIEAYTKINLYQKKKDSVKAGFSKLKVGQIAHVYGKLNPKEDNRMSATRLSVLSLADETESSPSPKITVIKEKESTPSATKNL